MKMDFKFGSALLCLCFLFGLSSAGVVEDAATNDIARTLDPQSILSSIATKFMSRAYTSGIGSGSQVVTFNLTNLLVLVLLKALIFAAGSLGAKHYKDEGYGAYGRTVEEEKFITDDEILMFLSYLSGSQECLQSIACQQPENAKKYIAAGDMLFRAAKMFSINPDINYELVLQEMERASNVGLAGGSCQNFECGTKQS